MLAPGLTCKHQIRLESPARDKHSSLLDTFVNYVRKKFYNIGLWVLYYKLFTNVPNELECLSLPSLSSLV